MVKSSGHSVPLTVRRRSRLLSTFVYSALLAFLVMPPASSFPAASAPPPDSSSSSFSSSFPAASVLEASLPSSSSGGVREAFEMSVGSAADERIVLAYPLQGCSDAMQSGGGGGGGATEFPTLQGRDVRESVVRQLSLKVAEYMYSSIDVMSGQGLLAYSAATPRAADLDTTYLSALQMEVTTVPRGMTDRQLADLANSLPCVHKAFTDSNKYATPVDNVELLALYNNDKDTGVDNGVEAQSDNGSAELLLFENPPRAAQRRSLQESLAHSFSSPTARLAADNLIKSVEEGLSACQVDNRLCFEGEADLQAAGESGFSAVSPGSPVHQTGHAGTGGSASPTDPLFKLQWSLQAEEPMGIQAERVWPWWTGASDPITIAVIDSGCDLTHPELEGKLWTNPGEICGDGLDNDENGFVDDCHGFDFANGDADPRPATSGHGTGAAGIIAAQANNDKGIAGICWGCKIMCLKFIGNGQGKVSDQVKAIDYAIKMGAKISNNSYGGYGFSELEHSAIQRAQLAGHLFVCSAGNNNLNTDLPSNKHTPSAYKLNNIVAVGAIDHRGDKARFSNYGKSSVDVLAPGVHIRTIEKGGSYAEVTGTSFAAPAAAGAAGLIWSAFPGLSYLQVRQALIDGCIGHFLDPSVKDLSVCNGRLNTHRSLYVAALMQQGIYPGRETLISNGGLRPTSAELRTSSSHSSQTSHAGPGITGLVGSFRSTTNQPKRPSTNALEWVKLFNSMFGV